MCKKLLLFVSLLLLFISCGNVEKKSEVSESRIYWKIVQMTDEWGEKIDEKMICQEISGLYSNNYVKDGFLEVSCIIRDCSKGDILERVFGKGKSYSLRLTLKKNDVYETFDKDETEFYMFLMRNDKGDELSIGSQFHIDNRIILYDKYIFFASDVRDFIDNSLLKGSNIQIILKTMNKITKNITRYDIDILADGYKETLIDCGFLKTEEQTDSI